LNPALPVLMDITPDALSTCSRWAAARGVTTEAMISGCMVAHLLRAGGTGGVTQIGSLALTLEGIVLYIRTVAEYSALAPISARSA
jgi:hypothetical protein